jgi:hypothetical protein
MGPIIRISLPDTTRRRELIFHGDISTKEKSLVPLFLGYFRGSQGLKTIVSFIFGVWE